MKIIHFASILVLAATTTVACGDDDDASSGPNGAAGKNGAAGNGSAGEGGDGTSTGTAGTSTAGASSAGSTNHAGAGGTPANEGGTGGTAGGETNVGGAAGGETHVGGAAGGVGGAAGGETSEGGAGGAGGEGGATELPDVLVPGPAELIGTWKESWGGTLTITENMWGSSGIVAYTSGSHAVYARNPSNADYNPRKFTKNVYTTPENDAFYYCTIVYSASTLEAAQADTAVADTSKLEDHGCGGFNWSKVTKQ